MRSPLFAARTDHDLTVFRSIFNRVIEQINQGLFYQFNITVDLNIGGDVALQIDPLLPSGGLH